MRVEGMVRQLVSKCGDEVHDRRLAAVVKVVEGIVEGSRLTPRRRSEETCQGRRDRSTASNASTGYSAIPGWPWTGGCFIERSRIICWLAVVGARCWSTGPKLARPTLHSSQPCRLAVVRCPSTRKCTLSRSWETWESKRASCVH